MRGRLHDPTGPHWPRVLVPIVGGLLSLVTLWTHSDVSSYVSIGLGLPAFAMLFLSPLLLGRRAPRDVEIVLGPGYVAFKGAGILTQRIRARDITGATTARHGQGLSMALARKGRNGVPVLLEVETEEAARNVRNALGIGHDGYGTLSWATGPRASDKASTLFRALGFGSFATVMLLMEKAQEFGGPLTALGWISGFYLVLLTIFHDESGPSVTLRPDGLLFSTGPLNHVPYDTIVSASQTPKGMTVRVYPRGGGELLEVPVRNPGRSRRGMSNEECAHVVSHIVAAGQRAQGAGAPKSGASARIEILAREKDDAPAAWLARIDGAAAMIGVSSGYRGSSLDPNDLWKTLEDPDADAHLRAAAARVLLQVEKATAPTRVDAAIAATRDEKIAKRIRIATEPDPTTAAAELEALEDSEAPRTVRKRW